MKAAGMDGGGNRLVVLIAASPPQAPENRTRRKTMRALALIVACVSSQVALAAAEKKPVGVGDWSEPVDGLRGRLMISQGRVLGDGKTRETVVSVELENVASNHSGERNVYFEPGGLKCELHDKDDR